MGFIPTNVLAGGNMLETLLRMPEFLDRARAAAEAGDDDCCGAACAKRCVSGISIRRCGGFDPWLRFGAGGPDAIRIQAGQRCSRSFSPRCSTRAGSSGRSVRPGAARRGLHGFRSRAAWCIGAYIAKVQLTQTFKPLLRMRLLEAVDNPRVRTTRFNDLFPLHLKVRFSA